MDIYMSAMCLLLSSLEYTRMNSAISISAFVPVWCQQGIYLVFGFANCVVGLDVFEVFIFKKYYSTCAPVHNIYYFVLGFGSYLLVSQ